jgi:hypothetical protein
VLAKELEALVRAELVRYNNVLSYGTGSTAGTASASAPGLVLPKFPPASFPPVMANATARKAAVLTAAVALPKNTTTTVAFPTGPILALGAVVHCRAWLRIGNAGVGTQGFRFGFSYPGMYAGAMGEVRGASYLAGNFFPRVTGPVGWQAVSAFTTLSSINLGTPETVILEGTFTSATAGQLSVNIQNMDPTYDGSCAVGSMIEIHRIS